MKEKHNIDRLFRERFKDFEVAPPEKVWQNIESELQEKKKRRVIPLWFRLSGVAAIFVIGLLLMQPLLFNDFDATESPVATEAAEGETTSPNRIIPTDTPVQPNETVTDAGNKVPKAVTPVLGTDSRKEAAKADAATGVLPQGSKDAVAYGSKEKGNRKNPVAEKDKLSAPKKDNTAVAQNERPRSENNKANQSAMPADDENNRIAGVQSSDEKAVAVRDANERENNEESKTDNLSGAPDVPKEVVAERQILLNEAIAETPADTTAAQPENELEKLLKEKLAEKEEGEKALAEASGRGKWNIKPQLAPVFYNSLSQGSPIDAEFAGNSKSFDNNLSYGVGIDYALTDRISIRSGINTVNLSYATNDIQFRASLNETTNNVSASSKANVVVQNEADQIANPSTALFIKAEAAQVFDGSLMQKTGYIEVPLEMSYAIVNKRFGINLIGGVSTLFLNENNVSVTSTDGYSTDVGQAENLNNIHFSTNVGLGFKYRFLKAFEANFEPMFKYQVNPYSGDAGNFKPYFIGLYTGISFSF